MSRRYGKGTDFDTRLRSFAEDEASSGNESELDFVKEIRKDLDLSQPNHAVTETQGRSVLKNKEQEQKDHSDSSTEEEDLDTMPSASSKRMDHTRKRKSPAISSDEQTEEEEEAKETGSDDPWDDEDPSADYLAFKTRRTQKRKAAAAETNRLRQQKKSRAEQATSIIGRKPPPKKRKADLEKSNRYISAYGVASDSEQKSDVRDPFLDDATPDYIESRKRKLEKLHEAGLRYPPCYDDIYFSDEGEEEEKPVLHREVKPQREKKDIRLKNSDGVIPAPIAQWLRDYQVDGVQFLHERFVRQTGAILGDDMGLGKTIQVIAFLTAAFGKTATKRDAKRMRKTRRAGDDRWYPRILIVCPGTLMQNWEDELEKWGWWEVDRYHGNPKDKRGVLNAMRGGRSEIMITTYSTYRNSESEINTIDWDCVIADECHQIKSKNAEITKAMNKINALCRIGLTGTAIQNKYEELWNLLNWVRPGDYGSAQEWKQNISLPLKIGQAHDATYAQLAIARSKAEELVDTILPDVFLRRMKTLIASQLPKKSDRVVFCQLTETQADAYRAFINSEMVEYIRRSKEPCDCLSGRTRGFCCYQIIPSKGMRWNYFPFPCMMTLQKLANHVALLLPNANDSTERQAKDLENLQIACPDKWRDLYWIKDNILNQSQRQFCGKWSVLKRLLNFWHQNGDKVLVFSHSVRLLRLLKALFDIDGTNYNWSYLDGSMPLAERSRAIADFNSNPSQFVFLISTKAGGVGLNITSANKVVVMDPNWNPAYDLQAQDRAYRIGQTRDVEVFRLVSSGTIEEVVYARQIYKQQQANIGYTASDERRYFKGVMDTAEKKGELFGLENLFSFEESGYLLRDIVRKTNVAETRAGVFALDFTLSQDDYESAEEEDALLSNSRLGIADDDSGDTGLLGNDAQMKRFAEKVTSPNSSVTLGKPKATPKRAKVNPINAILAKAGVQYTHENTEIIGESKVEAELSRRAREINNDVDMSKKRVFQGSQSQAQSQRDGLALHSERFSGDDEDDDLDDDHDDDDHDEDDDVRYIGQSKKGEFKINYKYRPPAPVRTRQFCSIAEMMGYSDPAEFALAVEEMTQEERRKVLGRFYARRRRELEVGFDGGGK